MTRIHQTSIVSKKSKLDNNVEIGPFCIIDDNVTIANNTKLISHIHISGNTSIGENNLFYPFSSIGLQPQDLKYNGEKTNLIIGNNNTFREHVTVNIGTLGGGMYTNIGNNCLLMVGVHIAHDCQIKNNVVFANNATLAGHVTIQDNAIIGGLSAIHQFVRIGKFAMIGGMSGVEQDIIPYGLYTGIRSNLRGLNIIGLKRKGLTTSKITQLKKDYFLIFNKEKSIINNIRNLRSASNDEINEIIDFIKKDSKRGICGP